MSIQYLTGDCREVLKALDAGSVHCCVTSPPYFGLRSYLRDGHPEKEKEIGLEQTPDEYVARMVEVFREVRRVLRDDGTLWLNLGDSYAGSGRGGNPEAGTKQGTNRGSQSVGVLYGREQDIAEIERERIKAQNAALSSAGIKPKDMIGIPWRVAFALQADGWYLRQWLPWVKRNPMPESTQDRPTSACEMVFMLTKSPRYFFDYEAVKRRMAPASLPRLAQDVAGQSGSDRANGGSKTNGTMKAVGRLTGKPHGRHALGDEIPEKDRRADKQSGHSRRHAGFNDRWDQMEREEQRGERAFRNSDLFFDSLSPSHGAVFNGDDFIALDVATQPFRDAHFATMPPKLAEPLIRASCPEGGTVLDPFGGAGTTGLVADRLQRNAILIDLNDEYRPMAVSRLDADQPGPLFARGLV